MDVDTVRKMRPAPPQECYRCREPNQMLTTEQREELIEDLMALKDVAAEEEVGSSPEEDFV